MARTPFSEAENRGLRDVLCSLDKQPGFDGWANVARRMGVVPQTVAKLRTGEIRWSHDMARQLARLVGKSVHALVGRNPDRQDVSIVDDPDMFTLGGTPARGLPNLEICLRFHLEARPWSPWTVAAARAGYYGPEDAQTAAAWVERLNALEAILAAAKPKERKHAPAADRPRRS